MMDNACRTKECEPFEFKAVPMDTENYNFPHVKSENERSFDQPEIFPEESREQLKTTVWSSNTLEDQRICRLCKQMCTYGFTPIKNLESDLTCNLKIPEVSSGSTNEPVVCSSCNDSLNTNRHVVDERKSPVFIKVESTGMKSEDEVRFTSGRDDEPRASQTSQSHQLTHKTTPGNHPPARRRNSDIQKYQCETCGYKTQHKRNFHRHLLKHKDISEVPIYKCEKCDFQSKYKHSLTDHRLTHESAQTFKCNQCNYESKFKKYLTRHQLVHRDDSEMQIYKCETCNYETKNKNYLADHRLVHKNVLEVPTYKCDKCDYKVKNKKYLSHHKLVHKDISEIPTFKCNTCDYRAKRKVSLYRHELKHKSKCEVQIYTCDTCGFETKYKSSLADHQQVHKDKSVAVMYGCATCGYKTKHKSCLARHSLRHKDDSEVQLYKCDRCEYETKHKRYLKQHQQVHKDVLEDVEANASPVTDTVCSTKEFAPFEFKAVDMETEDHDFPYIKSEIETPLDQPEMYFVGTDKEVNKLSTETNIPEVKEGPVCIKTEKIDQI